MSILLDDWCSRIPDDLVKSFADGEAPIVFLGAGLGEEVVPELKTGVKLAEVLRDELRVDDPSIPLAELLQFYKNCHSRSDRAVRDWIENQLDWGTCKTHDPGGAHHLLLQSPSCIFLTTNYDDTLDRAAHHALPPGAWHSTATIREFSMHRAKVGPSHKICAHIHGAFSAGITSPIVATTDDYIERSMKDQSWQELIKELLCQYRFVFIGYGMRDFTVWSSYFSIVVKDSRSMWPHAMVSPPHSTHDCAFWSQYNVHFIPLRAYQFSIALMTRLERLRDETVAVCASAACWKISVDKAQPRFRKLHKQLGYASTELTLRHIIDETQPTD